MLEPNDYQTSPRKGCTVHDLERASLRPSAGHSHRGDPRPPSRPRYLEPEAARLVFGTIYMSGEASSVVIYINLDIVCPRQDGIDMQAPPPPMMPTYGTSRVQWIVMGVVGLGLLLLAVGGVVINLGHNPTGPNDSLVTTWGPSVMDFGLFLLVGGLILGAVALENLDVFIRLFLLILAFVALLMILASPATFFP